MWITLLCLHLLHQRCFLFWQNFSLIPNQESDPLRIPNSSKESEGIYTCVCTWEHHGIKHNSSGSRRLIIEGRFITGLWFTCERWHFLTSSSSCSQNWPSTFLQRFSCLLITPLCSLMWVRKHIQINHHHSAALFSRSFSLLKV